MARIGYARVSTLDQDLDIQLAKLKAEGCGVIRSEKVSGGSRDGRAELATVLEFLRPGDELVVSRLDRLGRDTRDVLNLIHECEQREAFVTVLDPHVSTRGEMGHLVMTVLGMVAQMERWNGASSKSASATALNARKVRASTRAASAGSTGTRSGRYTPRAPVPLLLRGRSAARGCRSIACSKRARNRRPRMSNLASRMTTTGRKEVVRFRADSVPCGHSLMSEISSSRCPGRNLKISFRPAAEA